MATYAELKTRIADDFNRTDIASQIANEITRAITQYERTRFWFNETQAGSSLVVGQSNYAWASLSISDMLVLDAVEVTISGHLEPLCEVSWHEYMDFWRGSTTNGAPQEYALFQDKLWLGPAPAQTYSIDVSYIRSLPALSADSDYNSWTVEAEDLIASRAARMIAMRTLRLPTQDVTYFAQLEKEAWNALMLENDQRLMTGKMRYQE